jgi:hypothetical protein
MAQFSYMNIPKRPHQSKILQNDLEILGHSQAVSFKHQRGRGVKQYIDLPKSNKRRSDEVAADEERHDEVATDEEEDEHDEDM